ncbi:MAG: hypothetical protein KBT06_03575 [Prevotellaceae bacterium]|nr:hypothetical protein [Candidatus Colivivens equi]
MEKFNKNRFSNYARWDFTINQKLYKNIAITIVSLFLGVTLISFFLNYISSHDISQTSDNLAFAIGSYQATGWLSLILEWSVAISAGFLFHNMINKQSRIMELTIPATMSEKFWWHILINIGGVLILGICAYLVCDAIYALMTYFLISPQAVSSLFFHYNNHILDNVIQFSNIKSPESANLTELLISSVIEPIIVIAPILEFCKVFFHTGLFGFINSVKYKNNIPVTLLTMLIIYTIFIIVIIAISASFIFNAKDNSFTDDSIDIMITMLSWIIYSVYTFTTLQFLTGVCLWICTWKKYNKSQIATSKHN